MIDDLKRIETMMQECAADRGDNVMPHRDADKLMTDLVRVLSERLYDEEKASVVRILGQYTPAMEDKWWYA